MKDIDKMTCDEWEAYRRDKIDAHYAKGLSLTPDPTCGTCDADNDYVCFECELLQLDQGEKMKLQIIKTNNGYMVEHAQGDELGEYVCDTNGDNLFDTYSEAEDLMQTHLMTFGTDADNGMT
jgi:hypothetical protein